MSHAKLKEGVIRRVRGTERQDFRDHLMRLSPKNRRSRFGGCVGDAFIAQHVDRLFDGNAVAYGYVVDGRVCAAAELHPLGGAFSGTAEAAFSVEDDWQDAGIGTALLGQIMRSACNRGLSRLVMTCMPENVRMQRIAQKHGARLSWDSGDVVGSLNPPAPTPVSLWREAMDESHAFVTALFHDRVTTTAEH